MVNRLSSNLEDKILEIRSKAIAKCMNELLINVKNYKQFSSNTININDITKPQKLYIQNQILKMIDLIHQFLNTSEIRGLGNLKSHNALLPGKKLYIDVIDHISYGMNDRKTPILKISIYENDTLWDLRKKLHYKLKHFLN